MDKRQDRMAKRDAGDAKAGDAHRKHFRGRFHHGMHGGMLAQADANKDGVITKAEFQAKPLQMFAKMDTRSEEHTSELQSLMRISYAVFCLKKKKTNNKTK